MFKKLLIALLLLTAGAQAQTYIPTQHTVVSKPMGENGVPVDARSYYYNSAKFIYRPYQSTAEVLSYLNTSASRTGHFPVVVNTSGTVNPTTGKLTGGSNEEWWFKDGVLDDDLVKKSGQSSTIAYLDITKYGAVGDSVTDNTSAIQSVINIASSGNIKSIYIPKGNFKINLATIILPSNIEIYGSGKLSHLFSSATTGNNVFQAIGKRNISIHDVYISGKLSSGTAHPPEGVIDGQGVTLAFGNCTEIQIRNAFFSHNGAGSGNVYFSRTSNSTVANSYFDKTENAICVDNYYQTGGNSKGIIITDNVIKDLMGRGIAIDCYTDNYYKTNVLIANNYIKAAAFAGIQLDGSDVVVKGNIIDGARDNGESTVGTRDIPTYYGISSTIGIRGATIDGNIISNVANSGIRLTAFESSITNNRISLAVSYVSGGNTTVINNPGDNEILIFWQYPQYGLPGHINVSGNDIKRNRIGQPGVNTSTLISFVDNSVGSGILADSTFITVSNNTFNVKSAMDVISYGRGYDAYAGASLNVQGNTLISGNKDYTATFVSATPLKKFIASSNDIMFCSTAFNLSSGGDYEFSGNMIKNTDRVYFFQVGNVNNAINSLIMADNIIGDPSQYVFNGTFPNPYIVKYSDGSGMKFIGVSAAKIKATYYPAGVKIYGPFTAIPTTGMWQVGDVVYNYDPSLNNILCWQNTVTGTPGTWMPIEYKTATTGVPSTIVKRDINGAIEGNGYKSSRSGGTSFGGTNDFNYTAMATSDDVALGKRAGYAFDNNSLSGAILYLGNGNSELRLKAYDNSFDILLTLKDGNGNLVFPKYIITAQGNNIQLSDNGTSWFWIHTDTTGARVSTAATVIVSGGGPVTINSTVTVTQTAGGGAL